MSDIDYASLAAKASILEQKNAALTAALRQCVVAFERIIALNDLPYLCGDENGKCAYDHAAETAQLALAALRAETE